MRLVEQMQAGFGDGVLHSEKAPKGQLISKCPFGVIVWNKIPTKKFDQFLP